MAARKTGHQAQKVKHPLRGDIYLVNFDPTVGSEIRKTRPALIIQNDIANQYSPVTIVAAITSKVNDPPYPIEVILTQSRVDYLSTPPFSEPDSLGRSEPSGQTLGPSGGRGDEAD